jgi:transcriptional regulator with XRE-family HTH domain
MSQTTFEPRELPQPRRALRRAIAMSELAHWQVAYMAGLSASSLSRLLSGRREPSPDEARRLAQVLGVEPHDLFPMSCERGTPC